MKNGLSFDFNEYEKWKKEKAYKLQEIVIMCYLKSMDDYSDVGITLHGLCRELLLSAGFNEETLTLFICLYRNGDNDHAS